MSTKVNTGVNSGVPAGYSDVGEIYTAKTATLPQVTLDNLGEEGQARALPPELSSLPDPIAPLTKFLGAALTVGNGAWTGDPIPKARALQKKLLERSMGLDATMRPICLEAITALEPFIRNRLRYQQMRNLAEQYGSPEEGKSQ